MDKVLLGVLIPFLGTSIGGALVFFMRKNINIKINKILLGFAAGVMVAASVWSLIIPAIEQSVALGNLSWLPAVIGLIVGFAFLLILDMIINRINRKNEDYCGENKKKKSLLVLSITLHNIPEGMAVGVALAGAYYGNAMLSLSAALALAVGMAIQNIPEGAIVSMPLRLAGKSKTKSFFAGVLSGIVEPIFAVITFFITGFVTPILPYVLAFAAGSMLYVVVEEIIPEASENGYSNFCTIGFAVGFIIMLILDVSLG